ncbi:citrate/2-methylcitrate synthase [Loigolactobacillus binensis]|uniref:Citrate synthase n=1 Tax=Loigolactobacillus binensis TaxID=2559922 RepID=A0ABW3EFK3_9LACO|nr:citrate/2-methylcitrate synthase [Loigolactobacillus binensis]
MNLPKGLAGVVIADTAISSTKNDMLTYAGYPITELIAKNVPYEAVVFLLWHQRLPTAEELRNFRAALFAEMELAPDFLSTLKKISKIQRHPMSLLRTSVSFLGSTESKAESNATAIQAKVLMIVAMIVRLRAGKKPLKARRELDFAGNFVYLLTGKVPTAAENDLFNKVLLLHADHEFNASTFTARVAASTNADEYSCLTAAICTLKGPLHGGANEQVYLLLDAIRQSGQPVADYLAARLANHEKIMGFGHRIYKNGDPRAYYLHDYAQTMAQQHDQMPMFTLAESVAAYMWQAKKLKPNVDFYAAIIYHCLGVPHDIFTPIFAVSRTAGWLAHIREQKAASYLIRPSSHYTGKYDQTIPSELQLSDLAPQPFKQEGGAAL